MMSREELEKRLRWIEVRTIQLMGMMNPTISYGWYKSKNPRLRARFEQTYKRMEKNNPGSFKILSEYIELIEEEKELKEYKKELKNETDN